MKCICPGRPFQIFPFLVKFSKSCIQYTNICSRTRVRNLTWKVKFQGAAPQKQLRRRSCNNAKTPALRQLQIPEELRLSCAVQLQFIFAQKHLHFCLFSSPSGQLRRQNLTFLVKFLIIFSKNLIYFVKFSSRTQLISPQILKLF